MSNKKISQLNKGDKVILGYGDQGGDIVACRDFNKLISHIFHNSSYHAWEADVVSKPRGKNPTIVTLDVHGFETEIGDVYAYEIIGWFDSNTGTWQPIEHTQKQLNLKKQVEAMF